MRKIPLTVGFVCDCMEKRVSLTKNLETEQGKRNEEWNELAQNKTFVHRVCLFLLFSSFSFELPNNSMFVCVRVSFESEIALAFDLN